MSQTSRNSKIEEEVQKELAPLEPGKIDRIMDSLILWVFLGGLLFMAIATIKALLFS